MVTVQEVREGSPGRSEPKGKDLWKRCVTSTSREWKSKRVTDEQSGASKEK